MCRMLEAVHHGALLNFLWRASYQSLFVKTKYTIAADPPPGYLCHPCAKASGSDPFKKPPAPRKRKSTVEKRNILNHQERKFPTLVSLCIKVRVIVSIFAPFLTNFFCDPRSYPNILTILRHLGTSGPSISTRLFVSFVEIDPCKIMQLLIYSGFRRKYAGRPKTPPSSMT